MGNLFFSIKKVKKGSDEINEQKNKIKRKQKEKEQRKMAQAKRVNEKNKDQVKIKKFKKKSFFLKNIKKNNSINFCYF